MLIVVPNTNWVMRILDFPVERRGCAKMANLFFNLVIEPGGQICVSFSVTLSIPSSVSPSLLPLSDCHSTFMTGLCDVYPRQMGPGKMAAVALATEWRGNRGESERLFSFWFGCSGYQGDAENM